MEKQILEKLLKRGKADFMILRTDFPMTNEFGSAYDNLRKLSLIENEKVENETVVSLTLDGIDANRKGLNKWINEKVYGEIKNREFVLTKETTDLELKALRDLEDDGKIYEYNKRKYKVIPNQTGKLESEIKTEKHQNTHKINQTKKSKHNIKLNSLFQVLGWFISITIALLAIIEYKFYYVSSFWEWIIEKF